MKNPSTPQKKPDNLLWSVVFVLIAGATIWAVVAQSRVFSLQAFGAYVSGLSASGLSAALLCMLGFILFEGEAVRTICRAFGYPVSHRRGFIYSAADIYFSAITPSATGGQPACAYFMIKDGIPGSVTTVVLITNLILYTVSILVIGLFNLVLHPALFSSFGWLSQALIVFGYFCQAMLTAFFLLLLIRADLLHRLGRWALHGLCRLRLLRHEEDKQRRLDDYIEEYVRHVGAIKGHKKAMLKAFLFNFLQRMSVISVSAFLFLASGGELSKAGDIWAVHCYAVLGSNTVPIPGAMGVSDYIMLDGFRTIIPSQHVVSFELLSRSLSFYICIILCGITVLIQYLIQRNRERKR